ncbi:MAG: 50S ribosomal protein L24 [Candidatus Woesebacteria bacterium]|jgi:large subunit ribosomal protein L24
MLKIQKDDTVEITSGKDKGRKGEVEKVFPKEGKVLVSGMNIYKKHIKGMQGKKGGIYDIPRPLDVSKVALVCPNCKKPTRVGFRFAGKEKVRVCKKCNKEIRREAKKKS